METVVVNFHTLIQNSQEAGTNDEHMVSRVYFSLEARGVVYRDFYADIKQVVGSAGDDAPLEVGSPVGVGYRAAFNHEEFSRGVVDYFRSLVGSTGSAIRIAPGANVSMRNNKFIKERRVELKVDPAAGW